MTESHYDVIRQVSDGWEFRKEFIRALTVCRTEYKDKHPMAYAFGAELEPTGKYFCELCDGYLHDTACDGYEDWISGIIKRDVVNEYVQKTCPDCHCEINEMQKAEVVLSTPEFSTEPSIDGDIETSLKTQFLPCECLHDVGEEKIRWDLDKESLQADVDNGQFRFSGRVFREAP